MSNKTNDIILEGFQNRYEEAIAEKRWDLLSHIEIEMEEGGFSSLVPALSQSMTDEEAQEYKKWDREVNGSVETQTDDE